MFLIGTALAFILLLAIMHWWSEGCIEASDALLLAAVFCGLVFGLFAAHTLAQFLFAFIPLTGAGIYALYSYKLGGIKVFYKRRCEEYARAIQSDPRNRAAREYLADALYNLGHLDRAIDELQVAVNMGSGMECQYKLNKWLKERHFRDTPNPICRWCETENALGARKCTKCHADLPYDNAFSRWLMGGGKSGVRYYLLLVVGLALIGVSLLFLPIELAFLPLLLFVLALMGWSLMNSARS